MTKFSVSGKTAIVTGAGSGINLAFAELLLNLGCNVVLADVALRDEAKALLSRFQQQDKTPRAVFLQTDVTSWPSLTKLFQQTYIEFGDVDVVCPGAGVYEPHWSNFWHPPGSTESRDSPDAGHYGLLDINLSHPIRVTQLALGYWLHPRRIPGMKASVPAKVSKENPKRIIHISSIAAQLPVFRAPLYAASKFAVSGFVRSLAPLDEEFGIRVNAVAPGIVRTPLWTDHPEKLLNVDQSRDAWVTPQEVAEAMLMLVQDETYIGGCVLEVGARNTRMVDVRNDPGPDPSPEKGLVTSNADQGDAQVWTWLSDARMWKL